MLTNYLNIAWRNILRNKIFSLINIISIAIGLAAFWLIALYVGDELSYDRFLPNANRIYRIAQHASWENGRIDLPLTSPPFAPAMKAAFPEIEEAVRIDREGGGVISYADKKLKAGDLVFADSNFFRVFEYPFLYGDAKTALLQPNSIVITESLARKIFGDASRALNQTINFDGDHANTITGVIPDVPPNTHFQFSGVRSVSSAFTNTEWNNLYLYTYIKLYKNAGIKTLQRRLPTFAATTIQKEMQVKNYRLELQPLTSIHLHSNLNYELGNNGNISRVYMFIAIALLILAIAIINYMNLSTARASVRVKEVGIRKVVGSKRSHLVKMFITESVLLTSVAAMIAFLIVDLSLPVFNALTGKDAITWQFGMAGTVLVLLGFALTIGLISGVYPALFLSKFKTIPALRGQLGSMHTNIIFRKGLVVFQFMITVLMICGSVIIYRQMQYALHKDLGFNKEQTMTFHIDDMSVRNQIDALKTQLLKSPLIEDAAAAGNPIGNNDLGGHSFSFEQNGAIATHEQMAQELQVDEDFMETMDIQFLEGRNFSRDMPTDKTNGVIINETLMRTLGWKKGLGKKMQFRRNKFSPLEKREVIGVIKDFHTYSLQHTIEPLVIMMPPNAAAKDNLYIKIAKGKTSEALDYIKAVYAGFDKNNVAEFHFLDENFSRQYAAEDKQEQLSMIFTILAVVVACLGLLGLAIFTSSQRVKEIGIRKTLGATVTGITILLSKDFIKLVVIAAVLAIPLSWIIMNKWLQEFAYRISIEWWMFLFAGLLALVIALCTISIQAIKAALANPVKSLRSE